MEAGSSKDSHKRPIIITGCPRSGTLLTARILGGSKDHFLITEHGNKEKYCPEDTSGINDTLLWRNNNEYYLWDKKRKRPDIEMPVFDPASLQRIRDIYIEKANSKRLVLKNPAHLARISLIKKMFPNAYYVFCVRDPWHTIQSMIMKGNKAFLLNTFGNYCLPNDLLLKAAFSWGEAIDIYLRERDDNWFFVKYEDLLFDPEETITKLFSNLYIDDIEQFQKAVRMPKKRSHDYFLVKNLFKKNNYGPSIIKAIEIGCKAFSYSPSVDRLHDSGSSYLLYRSRLLYGRTLKYVKRVLQKLSKVLNKKIS